MVFAIFSGERGAALVQNAREKYQPAKALARAAGRTLSQICAGDGCVHSANLFNRKINNLEPSSTGKVTAVAYLQSDVRAYAYGNEISGRKGQLVCNERLAYFDLISLNSQPRAKFQ
jgi:hypothetical protein